jgi:hypothetical protein
MTISKAASVQHAQNSQGGRSAKGGGGATVVRPRPNHAHAAASAQALVASANANTVRAATVQAATVAQAQSRTSYGGGGALTGVTSVQPRVVRASVPNPAVPAPTTQSHSIPLVRDVRLANRNS